MKQCQRCGNEMPEHRVSKICSECRKIEHKKYYAKHKEEINRCTAAYQKTEKGKAIHRKYAESEHGREVTRKASVKYYYNNRDAQIKRAKAYRQTEAGRKAKKNAMKRYAETNKGRLRNKIRNATSYMLRQIDMSFKNCEVCCGPYEEFHHFTYDIDNPLDGIFVCKQCHVKIHTGEIKCQTTV